MKQLVDAFGGYAEPFLSFLRAEEIWSPELFFQVLSNRNGFAVERAIVCEAAENGKWFYAVDPAKHQRRRFFTNSMSTLLLVQARRLEQVPILQQAPQ